MIGGTSAQQTAAHEAHHVAALLLGGLPPEWVRIDRPDLRTAGSTRIDWHGELTREKVETVLQAILVGCAQDLEHLEDAGWPIDPQRVKVDCRRDAEQAAVLCRYLGLDEVLFGWHRYRANKLARTPRFKRLVVAIEVALEAREFLSQADLMEIYDAAREEIDTCS
jgi:hypothetical protein